MGTSGKLQARFIFRDGQKVFFKPAGLVFLGFIRFFSGFMGFIAFSPSNYWVLLVLIGFFPFLEWVFGYFGFLPFWAIFDFSPFHYQVLWCFIMFYWVFSLFWMVLGLFKKKTIIPALGGFLTGFFWMVFFGLGFFGHPWLSGVSRLHNDPEFRNNTYSVPV